MRKLRALLVAVAVVTVLSVLILGTVAPTTADIAPAPVYLLAATDPGGGQNGGGGG
jgi:hypothetical protein